MKPRFNSKQMSPCRNITYRFFHLCGIAILILFALNQVVIAENKPENLQHKNDKQQKRALLLTPEEQQWLLNNQNYVFDSPFLDRLAKRSPDGEHTGFLVDYVRLINKKLDSNFQLNLHTKKEMSTVLDQKPIISFFGATEDKQSLESYDFTLPILQIPAAFYSRLDEVNIEKIEDLNNPKVGIYDPIPELAHSSIYEYLSQIDQIDLVIYKSPKELLNALVSGQVDFIYGNQLRLQKFINENMILGVKINYIDLSHSIVLKIAVDKSIPILVAILNKAIKDVSNQEKTTLYDRWFDLPNLKENTIYFSADERMWMKDHPVVLYSDFSWMPYVSVDNDNVEGIAKDYLDIVGKETGIDFRFVPTENWIALIKELKDGNITLSLAAGKTEQRGIFADFSDPFITSPMGIITSKRFSYVADLRQLEGLTVAIPENLFFTDMLVRDYPQIKLIYTHTIEQAFTLVAKEEADAYVGNLAVAAFYLRKSKLANLQIAGTVDHQFSIHFMIRKGNPELVSIFNKVLSRVTDTQRREINNRWFSISYQSGVDPKIIWQIVVAAVIILFIVLYWVGRLRKEITLRKLTERSLKSARVDAERANQAKSEFLANMSHEIRTPMNAVIGFTQLMLETKLTNKQQNYLDSIKVGGNGLLHIINDILDLSKIEAGKLSIEYTSVDLYKLLEEMYQIFEASMQDKGLSFSINIANDVPKYLVLAGNRVRQVLLNLIGNAQKFTEQGAVEINVSTNNDSTDMVSIQLTIQIKDSGIGIEVDSMDQIFRNFEQHKKLNTQKYGGTGLGLAISRKLTEKMNGQLTATSQIGKGSVFTLQLNNVAIASSVIEHAVVNHDYQFDRAVIMVVDDVDTNRMVVCKYLESFPFELIEARNGIEAISLALKVKPDLILMDLRMPEMDGYQATINIKKKLKVPIIALTASALEDKDSKQEKLIFDHYLRKPILKTKLVEAIGKFLGHDIITEKIALSQIKISIAEQHHQRFKEIVSGRLLEEMKTTQSIGQFSKIEDFAQELNELANLFEIKALRKMAEQLNSATEEFDIEKIDYSFSQLQLSLEEFISRKQKTKELDSLATRSPD